MSYWDYAPSTSRRGKRQRIKGGSFTCTCGAVVFNAHMQAHHGPKGSHNRRLAKQVRQAAQRRRYV